MLQKVVDFDPTSLKVGQEHCRDAIRAYKQTLPHKKDMFPAAAALHNWLGAVFWVRKEMRAAASIVRQTTVDGLNTAITRQDVEKVRTIVEVDLFSGEGVDQEGDTPLHAAATKGGGDEALTQLILSMDFAHGMVDAIDNAGRTPIHHAVDRGISTMVRSLSNANADLNALDVEQRTPLMCAIQTKDLSLVQQLLDGGADPNLLTSNGSAMDIAAGWDDGQEILQAYGAMTSGALGVKAKRTNGDIDEGDEGDAGDTR